jgi:hypothetical protein
MMTPYDAIPNAVRNAVADLPPNILGRSGSIFYSGKEAYVDQAPLYILGLNPGGIPSESPTVTVASSIEKFKQRNTAWSEYADESWEDAPPGQWGLQPRILHMLAQLGLDPRMVPTSNVVFVQSRNEQHLEHEKAELLEACWPLHDAVINELGVRTVLCFGGTAGRWVCEKLGADALVDSFQETNKRGWTSKSHRNSDGLQVVTVTHPSRVDWRNPMADPTPLVERVIARGR